MSTEPHTDDYAEHDELRIEHENALSRIDFLADEVERLLRELSTEKYRREDAERNEKRANDRLVQWKEALGTAAEMAQELAELRPLVREVHRWLKESDAERNEGGNRHVHTIAPLDSAERIVGISLHLLGRQYPHLSAVTDANGGES